MTDVESLSHSIYRARFAPRGLRRKDVANYLSISMTAFDGWVKRGLMPAPKEIGGIVVWDRHEIDDAFDALSETPSEEADVWANVSL
jgi:predicted DNA-binding transcriptional regulator AlpA